MDTQLQNSRPDGFLRVTKLHSIKTRILVFALLATIVPSLILGGLFYYQNSKLLAGKISQQLRSSAVQASSQFDLWLKERLYDLRVFASSYIISENFKGIVQGNSTAIANLIASDHIEGYLRSVGEKFSVYSELTLLGLDGKALLTTAPDLEKITVPKSWLEQLNESQPASRKHQLPPQVAADCLFVAEAIRSSDGSLMGYLSAAVELKNISAMLASECAEGTDEIYLMDAAGSLLVSSNTLPADRSDPVQVDGLIRSTRTQAKKTVDYAGRRGRDVIAAAAGIPAIDWLLVAEMDREKAYAEIMRLRKITLVLVGGLMLCIGLSAYLFGHALVQPLRRLSREAACVASGNLDVEIPVTGCNEVSYLTQVFNHMVSSLKQNREEISAANDALVESVKELHQLSVTDGLTGLNNRKHIMDLFDRTLAEAAAKKQALAVLLLDIDHFKEVNDTYGHQTGDDAMRRLAENLLEAVSLEDHVGRYGGEEFLIVLPDRSVDQAVGIAEQIRRNVSSIKLDAIDAPLSISVSIGVAGFPDNGVDVASILRKADDALYRAKDEGRNCVKAAEAATGPSKVLTFSAAPQKNKATG